MEEPIAPGPENKQVDAPEENKVEPAPVAEAEKTEDHEETERAGAPPETLQRPLSPPETELANDVKSAEASDVVMPLIMKTVNDRQFDVSLILKFNKNDYKKTKVCREGIKPALKALE